MPKRIAMLGVTERSILPVFSAHKVIAEVQGDKPRIVPISLPEITPGVFLSSYHSAD